MAKYRCTVCNYLYDEDEEGKKFKELPDDWRCPVCNSPKSVFVLLTEEIEEYEKGDTTVSDILVQQMVELGLKHVFGIPGTSILGVVDAIKKNDKLEFIQVRHEQTAAFMASAYGKLTGNIAACLSVAGPGSTNLATGLYDAKLDNSPVVALTGMVQRQLIGPGSFQEIDQYSFLSHSPFLIRFSCQRNRQPLFLHWQLNMQLLNMVFHILEFPMMYKNNIILRKLYHSGEIFQVEQLNQQIL